MAKGTSKKRYKLDGLSNKARKRKVKEETIARERAEQIEKVSSYVKAWASRGESGSAWKFNKAKELWVLRHARDRARVSKDVFKLMLPYIASVQGGSRERLAAELKEDIEGGEKTKALAEQVEGIEKKITSWEETEKKEADLQTLKTRLKHTKAKLKRTKKILKALKKTDGKK